MQYLRLDEILEDVSTFCGETIEFERLRFNGGENHIKLTSHIQEQVTIEAQLKNSDYMMELLLATDALRRAGATEISLLAPYIPYGRQDRVMVLGEPLSIKVFAQLINSQNYKTVYTFDNHSEVTNALLNNCVEISNHRMVKTFVYDEEGHSVRLVSPDGGSLKKVFRLAQDCNRQVITASKHRDVATGKITGTEVHARDLTGSTCVIVDDICDGGRTFVELAKALKEKGAKKVILYVSHGIFSYGTIELCKNIDKIYTTNCFRRASELINWNVNVIPLRKDDLR
ncbi:MAG: ribose-phosphate pyrophosphokinase [Firmicutes bacterium]|nr:ribose-phosphate pyrophosphokinase [Bacillota bacterium]